MSRSTSILSSISRSYLSILNAINLARLAGQGLSSQELELNSKISDIMRKLAKETDPEKIGLLNEELGILKAQLKEITDQKIQQGLEGIGIGFATISITLSSIVKMLPQIKSMIGFLSALGSLAVPSGFLAVLGAAAAPIIAIAAAIAAAAIGLTFLLGGLKIEPFQTWAKAMEPIFGGLSKFIIKLFTIDWPNMIFFLITKLGELQGWFERIFNSVSSVVGNALIFIKDSVTSFFNEIVRQIVNFVNYVNSIIFKKGSKTSTSAFSGQSGSSVVNSLHAATGFEGMITKPTLMTVAESGSEYVSVTPHGRGPSGGPTIIVNVHGSILSERQLFTIVDGYLKDSYKRRGFTGV